MTDNLDKNVLKNGKDGIKQNMLKVFDEFIDVYADEMWQIVNELIKLKAEKSELLEKTEKLETEVAELRARLEKAVELPVKMGDWVYCITDNRIIGGEVSEIHIEEFNTTITFVQYDFDGECIGEWYIGLENYNKTWFTTRVKAEARLKELQEEEE